MANLEQRIQRVKALIDWLEGFILLPPGEVHKEYTDIDDIVKQSHIYNPWFIEPFNRKALSDFLQWLKNMMLTLQFRTIFADQKTDTRQIAVLTLPNVPLSGAREAILLYLAGHRVVLRNADHKADLLQCLTQSLVYEEGIEGGFRWVNSFPRDTDGWVIFEQPEQNAIHQYFNDRKSLFLAVEKQFTVLNGTESAEQLDRIADLIFIYWGFSEGNVRKLFLAKDYNFNSFFEAIEKYSFVYQYNCYANNYDYHKSVLLMNRIPFLDNGFILLREDASTSVPIGCLYYEYFSSHEEESKLMLLSADASKHLQYMNSKLLIDFIKSF